MAPTFAKLNLAGAFKIVPDAAVLKSPSKSAAEDDDPLAADLPTARRTGKNEKNGTPGKKKKKKGQLEKMAADWDSKPSCCKRVDNFQNYKESTMSIPDVAAFAAAWQRATEVWERDTVKMKEEEAIRKCAEQEAERKRQEEARVRFERRTRMMHEDIEEMEREEAEERKRQKKEDEKNKKKKNEKKSDGPGSGKQRSTSPLYNFFTGYNRRPSTPGVFGGTADSGNADGTVKRIDIDELDDVARHSVPLNAFANHLSACDKYKRKMYDEAVRLFTMVIEASPESTTPGIWGNRAAAYYQLGNYGRCVQDSLRSTEADSDYLKGHIRAARCYVMLQNIKHARLLQSYLLQLDDAAKASFDLSADVKALDALEAYKKAAGAEQYDVALRHIQSACNALPKAMPLNVIRLDCLIHVNPDEAMDEVVVMLDDAPNNPDLLFLKGLLLYQRCCEPSNMHAAQQCLLKAVNNSVVNDHERARKLLRTLQKMDALRAMAISHTNSRRWKQCVSTLEELLALDIDNLKLRAGFLFQKARAENSMGRYRECVDSCCDAFLCDEVLNRSALLSLRAEGYHALGQLEAAIRDTEEAYKLNPTSELFDRIDCLRRERSRAKNTEYHHTSGGYKSGTAGAAPSSGSTGSFHQAWGENGAKDERTHRPSSSMGGGPQSRPSSATGTRGRKSAWGAAAEDSSDDSDDSDGFPKTKSSFSSGWSSFSGSFSGGAKRRPSSAGPRRNSYSAGFGASGGRSRPSTPTAPPPPPKETLFDVLGLSRNADTQQVSRAFREAALKWHPDKWMTANDANREHAEQMFKKINHANSVLSDEASRREYRNSL